MAITALVVMFFARHRRRDLVVPFVTVNVGVLAVASILCTTEVGLGVGLGLFGVLSIIRLRSAEISQHEVAYYFAALAMGLVAGLAGLATTVPWFSLAVMALVLVVIGIADQPKLLRRYRQQRIVAERLSLYSSWDERAAEGRSLRISGSTSTSESALIFGGVPLHGLSRCPISS